MRDELGLIVSIAATLVAAFVLRGSAAGLALLALVCMNMISGAIAGAAWSPTSAPLFWSGLAGIGAGALAAVESRRALLVIPGGLILGIVAWVAYFVAVRI